MSTETTLLRCPFCAGEASIEEWEDGESEFSVGCNDAGCLGHETLECRFETPEIATDTWNRRALQPKVVAKPIEWGERNGLLIQSKCGHYDLRLGAWDLFWRAWSNDDRAFSPLTISPCTMTEAKAACQAHAQDKVDRFLLDCDIVIIPTPQP